MLQRVTVGYEGLQKVTGVTRCYRGLDRVTDGTIGLHVVTRGYRG